MEKRKVAIIGDGFVGSSLAFSLCINSSINEIVIIDLNKDKASGDALDLSHGLALSSAKKVYAGDYCDIVDAHVIIISAGVNQKEGETRLELLGRNVKIFESIIASLKPYLNEEAIILVASNPVDLLALYTFKTLNISPNRVIGTGTVLDSARLKYLLGEETKIDPRSIHAYIIGEHGDSEVASFSTASIAGIPLKNFCKKCGKCNDNGAKRMLNIANEVKNSAYEIIKKKGATYYGIALASTRIIEAIYNNENSVFTVSSYLTNAFDGKINDIYLSLPCIINYHGVNEVLYPPFSENEINQLVSSMNSIKEAYLSLK